MHRKQNYQMLITLFTHARIFVCKSVFFSLMEAWIQNECFLFSLKIKKTQNKQIKKNQYFLSCMYMYNVIYMCINFIKYLSVLELTYLFLIFHDYRWILQNPF